MSGGCSIGNILENKPYITLNQARMIKENTWEFPWSWGYPDSSMVYFMENPTQMDDDWGYPHFRTPPNPKPSRRRRPKAHADPRSWRRTPGTLWNSVDGELKEPPSKDGWNMLKAWGYLKKRINCSSWCSNHRRKWSLNMLKRSTKKDFFMELNEIRRGFQDIMGIFARSELKIPLLRSPMDSSWPGSKLKPCVGGGCLGISSPVFR